MATLRANARRTIQEQYDLRNLLPQQLQWMMER
jgi:hypothetical protein